MSSKGSGPVAHARTVLCLAVEFDLRRFLSNIALSLSLQSLAPALEKYRSWELQAASPTPLARTGHVEATTTKQNTLTQHPNLQTTFDNPKVLPDVCGCAFSFLCNVFGSTFPVLALGRGWWCVLCFCMGGQLLIHSDKKRCVRSTSCRTHST